VVKIKTSLQKYLYHKKAQQVPALLTYLPALYPDKELAEKWFKLLLKTEVDAVEIGIPSRNPARDGEIISQAHSQVWQEGYQPQDYLEYISALSEKYGEEKIIAMGYWEELQERKDSYLPGLLKRGLNNLLFPDLKDPSTIKALQDEGFQVIPFVAGETLSARDYLASFSQPPFIYCTSYQGKTGNSDKLDKDHLVKIRERTADYFPTEIPRLVGFGIDSGEKAAELMDLGFDGIIVGSALLQALERSEAKAQAFIRDLQNGLERS